MLIGPRRFFLYRSLIQAPYLPSLSGNLAHNTTLLIMFYRILTGLLPAVPVLLYGGQTNKLDSLLKKLRTAKEDTAKVMLLRDIGANMVHQAPLAMSYWKQGAALSKRLNYIVGAARCYINIATGYSFAGQLDSSVIYSDTAIYYTKLTKRSHQAGPRVLSTGPIIMSISAT